MQIQSNKDKIINYFFISFIFLFPFNSFSQDAFYASGLLGLNRTSMKTTVENNNVNTSMGWLEITFGLRLGVLFNDHFSAGVYLQRFSDSVTDINDIYGGPVRQMDLDITTNNLMAEFTYHFGEVNENGFWISGLLGLTQIKSKFTTDQTNPFLNGILKKTKDEYETSIGLSLGYHFMISPNFSFDPQFTYIYVPMEGEGEYSRIRQYSALLNITFWL